MSSEKGYCLPSGWLWAVGSVEALLVTARCEVVTEVVRCMGQVGAEVPGYSPCVLAAEANLG